MEPSLVDLQFDQVALGDAVAISSADLGLVLTKRGDPKPYPCDAAILTALVVVGAIFWAGVVMLFFGTWK